MEQFPRRGLRIFLFEVREELCVSKVLQAGGVVGHDVEVAREEERGVAVSMQALVGAGVVA